MANPFGDPSTMALMGLAQGLLQAGAPSPMPTNLGGALAQGFGGALNNAMNTQKYNLMAQQTALTGLNAAHSLYQAQLQNWWLGGRKGPAPTPPAITGFPGLPDMTSTTPQSSAPQQPASAGQSAPASTPWNAAPGQPFQMPTAPSQATQATDPISQLPQYAQDALTADMLFHGGAGAGSIIMEANKPQSTRYGIYSPDPKSPGNYRLSGGMMPQGALPIDVSGGTPKISPLPGQIQATTDLTRAAEEGKAPFAFEPYTLSGGQTIGVPKNIASQGPEAIKKYVAGLVNSSASAPRQTPSPKTSADPWSNIPQIPQSTAIGQSTYDKNIAEGRAKAATSLSEKYGAAAQQADQRVALNNQVLSLVDQADTGPGAATQAEVKSWLVKFAGIPEADFENTPSATKALDKDLLNAATQKAKAQFGARITQQEVQLMLSRGSPNVDMPKAAIKYLVDADNAANTYTKQQSADLGRYLSAGGDPHQFEGWYAKTFPMTKAVEGVHLPQKETQSTTTFEKLPSAAQYKGRTIKDTATGKLMKSDGMTWRPQ